MDRHMQSMVYPPLQSSHRSQPQISSHLSTQSFNLSRPPPLPPGPPPPSSLTTNFNPISQNRHDFFDLSHGNHNFFHNSIPHHHYAPFMEHLRPSDVPVDRNFYLSARLEPFHHHLPPPEHFSHEKRPRVDLFCEFDRFRDAPQGMSKGSWHEDVARNESNFTDRRLPSPALPNAPNQFAEERVTHRIPVQERLSLPASMRIEGKFYHPMNTERREINVDTICHDRGSHSVSHIKIPKKTKFNKSRWDVPMSHTENPGRLNWETPRFQMPKSGNGSLSVMPNSGSLIDKFNNESSIVKPSSGFSSHNPIKALDSKTRVDLKITKPTSSVVMQPLRVNSGFREIVRPLNLKRTLDEELTCKNADCSPSLGRNAISECPSTTSCRRTDQSSSAEGSHLETNTAIGLGKKNGNSEMVETDMIKENLQNSCIVENQVGLDACSEHIALNTEGIHLPTNSCKKDENIAEREAELLRETPKQLTSSDPARSAIHNRCPLLNSEAKKMSNTFYAMDENHNERERGLSSGALNSYAVSNPVLLSLHGKSPSNFKGMKEVGSPCKKNGDIEGKEHILANKVIPDTPTTLSTVSLANNVERSGLNYNDVNAATDLCKAYESNVVTENSFSVESATSNAVQMGFHGKNSQLDFNDTKKADGMSKKDEKIRGKEEKIKKLAPSVCSNLSTAALAANDAKSETSSQDINIDTNLCEAHESNAITWSNQFEKGSLNECTKGSKASCANQDGGCQLNAKPAKKAASLCPKDSGDREKEKGYSDEKLSTSCIIRSPVDLVSQERAWNQSVHLKSSCSELMHEDPCNKDQVPVSIVNKDKIEGDIADLQTLQLVNSATSNAIPNSSVTVVGTVNKAAVGDQCQWKVLAGAPEVCKGTTKEEVASSSMDENNRKKEKYIFGEGLPSSSTAASMIDLYPESGPVTKFTSCNIVHKESCKDVCSQYNISKEEERDNHTVDTGSKKRVSLQASSTAPRTLVNKEAAVSGLTSGNGCNLRVHRVASEVQAKNSAGEVKSTPERSSTVRASESLDLQEAPTVISDGRKIKKQSNTICFISNPNSKKTPNAKGKMRSEQQQIGSKATKKRSLSVGVTSSTVHDAVANGNVNHNNKFGLSLPPSAHDLLRRKISPPKGTTKTTRTWHRAGINKTSTPPLPVNESNLRSELLQGSFKKILKPRVTSYIRKGNSLVRKESAMTKSPILRVTQLVAGDITGTKTDGKISSGVHKTTSSRSPANVTTVGVAGSTMAEKAHNEELKRPQLLSTVSITSNVTQIGNASDSKIATENKIDKSSPVVSAASEHGLKTKKLTYMKHGSNRLVAACRTGTPNVTREQDLDMQSTDSYCKRKKNQIVRNVALPQNQGNRVHLEGTSNSGHHMVLSKSPRSSSKRRLGRNLPASAPSSSQSLLRSQKLSRFSLVWMPGVASPHKVTKPMLRSKVVLPYLLPWKRTTYLRCRQNKVPSKLGQGPMSLSEKLLLLRKRATVYTRSRGGFALRKSQVLSGSGSNLKWSKSLERHSKQVNMEATIAVAEDNKRRRELKRGISAETFNVKKRKISSNKSVHRSGLQPGERIFRVGSVRYKMDASRRTLARISDVSDDQQRADSNNSKSFVPKRLLIGNEEYVCVGNGNKLVRDPKKLKRLLANEKVRWSLHNARRRLAKKQQYCQFFTRFGKCNKEHGKCPYIHDPDKIAVCTKFLKGSCSETGCKLTHKVIPERMEDCSYFLQAMCSNEKCPYRHVNVNPDAAICEGFLRGYCAEGNECRKRHSYTCPHFEREGFCPLGSLCKLHHPVRRSRYMKRKLAKEPKKTSGRYFGSSLLLDQLAISEIDSWTTSSCSVDDIFLSEGRFVDYVGLDVSEDEVEKRHIEGISNTVEGGTLEFGSLDALIKPILLMKKGAAAQPLLADTDITKSD